MFARLPAPSTVAEGPRLDARQARVERYRQEAARLFAVAETAHSPVRQQLQDIARQYEILAKSIELLPPDRYP